MAIEYDITDEEILAEEDLPESTPQSDLAHYLLEVLLWLYRVTGWFIGDNLAIVYESRKYVAPDMAVFKGVVLTPAQRKAQKSYRINLPERPPPQIVFEIGSKDTWQEDLGDKVERYRIIGVKEYFTYDPNTPQVWRERSRRLRGWRYINGLTEELVADGRGWLWSEELESWVGSDDEYIRLYDRQGQRHLTEAEAGQVEARQALQREQDERVAKEAAWAKLRELGIDPENL